MSTSDAPRSTPTSLERPTERDLDRVTAAIRSTGREHGIPSRVLDRYQQWIFLFAGWCLKTAPGSISRERIGDFWAALSEHPETGTARICEAMDALGFFFGRLQQAAQSLFLPGGTNGPQGEKKTNSTAERTEGFVHPNPSLQAEGATEARPDGTAAPSDRELSRHLPSGTLPEDADARSEIPTRPGPRAERPPKESKDTRPNASSHGDDSPGRLAGTLFHPEAEETTGASDSSRPPATPSDGEEPPAETAGPGSRQGEHQRDGRAEGNTEHAAQNEEAPNADADRVPVHIPRSVADQLQHAARRLGLPPSVFAARAIELVCGDLGGERGDAADAGSPLERYQVQLDLLRLQKEQTDTLEGGPSVPMG